jgi:hypothetical protein
MRAPCKAVPAYPPLLPRAPASEWGYGKPAPSSPSLFHELARGRVAAAASATLASRLDAFTVGVRWGPWRRPVGPGRNPFPTLHRPSTLGTRWHRPGFPRPAPEHARPCKLEGTDVAECLPM